MLNAIANDRLGSRIAEVRGEGGRPVVAEAEARGGGAVVVIRFDTSEAGGARTEICAQGTAVRAGTP